MVEPVARESGGDLEKDVFDNTGTLDHETELLLTKEPELSLGALDSVALVGGHGDVEVEITQGMNQLQHNVQMISVQVNPGSSSEGNMP